MRTESLVIPLLRATARYSWLNRLLFAGDPWGNPFADEVVADHYLMVSAMWEDGPVAYRRFWGRWFVMGYEECQIVLNHSAASAGADVAGLVDEVVPYRRLAPATKAFYQQWMLLRDGADHHALRSLVSRAFTPRRTAALTATIEAEVAALLDAVDGRAEIEMVEAFNRRLPIRVIGALLGLPENRWEWAGGIVAELAGFLEPTTGLDVAGLDATVEEFRREMRPLIDARRRAPADDLLSDLVAVGDDGATLSDDEVVANAGFLVFAGHETVTGMLGTALVALADHPEQQALVAADPGLWPTAVDELLRWDPPVFAVVRRATADIELGDQLLPSGSLVSVELAAANRDARRWPDPWELRLDRPDARPLSFGFGLHHCLGHALARLELQIALRAITERFGAFTIDRSRVEWRRSALLRGPTSLYLVPG